MTKEVREAFAIRRKMVVLEYARLLGSVTEACREFEVPRSSFYVWKKSFDAEGRSGQEETGRKTSSTTATPAGRGEDPSPETYIPSRASENSLVPRALSRDRGLLLQRLSHSRPERHEKVAEEGGPSGYPHTSLRQAGSRPPHSGGREVSHYQGGGR